MLTTLMLVVAASTGATAQTFVTLLNFNGADGASSYGGLVQTTNGNLYGTTYAGGANDWGTVFVITPTGKLTTLYSFDLADHSPAGLVQATNGNIYGTTEVGGANGDGTVFVITSGTLTTLYSFCAVIVSGHCADGASPVAGVVQATNGDFYGATYGGGTYGNGTVFKITPSGKLTTLYNFCAVIVNSYCTDGEHPNGGLVQAINGNLYGTTSTGGGKNDGTVFVITPTGKLTTLHSFDNTDGYGPVVGLVQATNGDFYGATEAGGGETNSEGTVFKITPSGTLTTLYSFCSLASCTDGANPYEGLVQATNGNFYGTTNEGGANDAGTVFELSPEPESGCATGSNPGNGWCETVLHSFGGLAGGGGSPYAELVQDTNGTFYGTTSTGGTNGNGTIFSLSVKLSPFVKTVVPSGTGVQARSGREGAEIGIMGQGFSSASVVKFGGTQATTVTLSGTTYLTAKVPPDALTGFVEVTTGTTTLTSPQTFKVTPTTSSFAPPDGPVGTPVTITGTGLEQATKVTFDGKSAAFTVISDTEVTADVPADAVTGKITVTTKGGSATSATSFTVN
jgi:uncharacterized repeat protein (TIGR03803 family)